MNFQLWTIELAITSRPFNWATVLGANEIVGEQPELLGQISLFRS
jgi:hypothetical protein